MTKFVAVSTTTSHNKFGTKEEVLEWAKKHLATNPNCPQILIGPVEETVKRSSPPIVVEAYVDDTPERKAVETIGPIAKTA